MALWVLVFLASDYGNPWIAGLRRRTRFGLDVLNNSLLSVRWISVRAGNLFSVGLHTRSWVKIYRNCFLDYTSEDVTIGKKKYYNFPIWILDYYIETLEFSPPVFSVWLCFLQPNESITSRIERQSTYAIAPLFLSSVHTNIEAVVSCLLWTLLHHFYDTWNHSNEQISLYAYTCSAVDLDTPVTPVLSVPFSSAYPLYSMYL